MYAFYLLLKQYHHRLIAIGFLISAVFLMFSVNNRVAGWVSPIRKVAMDFAGSVQQVALSPLELYQEVSVRTESMIHLDEENHLLQQELRRVRPQLERLEELAQENQRLRRLLQMKPDPIFKTKVARVVGGTASPFVRTFILNTGESDGLRLDAPVMGAEGLMGRVMQTGRNTAMVLSLLDINSRVPVLVQRSRVQAVAAGLNDREISLEYVPKGADIYVDDLIVTSGIGGIFPKGLVIGRVITVEPDGKGLFQRIIVRSAVDFDRTEEVRILLSDQLTFSP